jgi:neutral amino acid transport system ATP-binding protein
MIADSISRTRFEGDVDPVAARAALSDVAWEPGVAKPNPILVAHEVKRSFGGLLAVDVDHVEIQRGVITALIGPNGAGKTTFFNLLTNFDHPDTGTRVFDGQDIGDVPAHKIANFGMVRTFQLTKALSKMSCIDNMKLGATDQKGESLWRGLLPFLWRDQEARVEARADALLERFTMAHMRDEYAGTLSGGQRKLLEMARALMVEPAMVMLDEPMAGVNPALTQSLLGHITGLRDQGMTVLFVEHDMDMVQEISDWVVVMAEGRIIAEGPPATIGQNQAVVDAYLGSSHGSALHLDDDPDATDETDETDEAEHSAEPHADEHPRDGHPGDPA